PANWVTNSPLYANVVMTDHNSYTATSGYSSQFTVNAVPTVSISPASNTAADVGMYESFNGVVTAGVAPFNVFLYISNSITSGTIVYSANAVFTGQAWSFTGIQIPANWVTNSPLYANVILTDKNSIAANSVYSSSFTVNAAASITISPASNTAADQGMYESFNGVITPGVAPYNVFLYVSNTAAPGNVVYSTNAVFSGTAWSFNGILIPANWVTNSPLYANVVMTDHNSYTATSGYSSQFTVNAVPTVSISPASNTAADVGMYESFNGVVTAGVAPFNVFLYISNSITSGTIVYSANAVFTGQAWSFTGIQIPANWVTNSPLYANVILTDKNSIAANSVYSSSFTVNAAASITISPASNTAADQGMYESFNGVITPGVAPYNVFLYVSNTAAPGNVVYSTNAVFSGTAWSFNGILIPANWVTNSPLYANVVMTDHNSYTATSGYSSQFTVNAVPTVSISPASNTAADVGMYESFNGVVTAGVAPFNVFLYISNSITSGTIVYSANAVFTGQAWSFTGIQIPANWVTNSPLYANVILTDKNSIAANSVYSSSFTVNAAASITISPASNTAADQGMYESF